MAEEKQSIVQQMLAKREEWAQQQPTLGAELAAMAREAVKDVRQTLMESYFGKPEHAPEMGTPLNPTPYETTEERGLTHENILDRYTARGRGPDEEQQGMER